ncbi:hypothetical protein ROR02_30950 [Pararhodospirillum oryzae]|uniref:Uncharacterized protein n=2 Tax=Pararhodospirillum oryzae TaxID=478448 RepID=A0A512HBZ2_9PROT|nr:hypothetical protein ROR02_30950 [Pararhodospirillum oryzae]
MRYILCVKITRVETDGDRGLSREPEIQHNPWSDEAFDSTILEKGTVMMNRFFLVARALGLTKAVEFNRHWSEHSPAEEGAFQRALARKTSPLAPTPWVWL